MSLMLIVFYVYFESSLYYIDGNKLFIFIIAVHHSSQFESIFGSLKEHVWSVI